jgi:hypothetical protein
MQGSGELNAEVAEMKEEEIGSVVKCHSITDTRIDDQSSKKERVHYRKVIHQLL